MNLNNIKLEMMLGLNNKNWTLPLQTLDSLWPLVLLFTALDRRFLLKLRLQTNRGPVPGVSPPGPFLLLPAVELL